MPNSRTSGFREGGMASIDLRIPGAVRAALYASSALALVPGTALAQEAPVADQNASAESTAEQAVPTDDQAAGIEEIVVTAQRREERLQDVPLSVTAISGEDLRNADLRDVTRL